MIHEVRHGVEVFERMSVPKAIGAGIMLQPTGRYVLSHLGMFDEALSQYSKSRQNHLSNYRWISLGLTPFFQSQHSWLTWIRDDVMPLLTLIPFSCTIMFSTLIGIRQGVFCKPLKLSHPQPNKP